MPKPVHKSPKPVAKMVERLTCAFDKLFDEKCANGQLPIALDAAVPLWAHQFKDYTEDERAEVFKQATSDDLCLRMEYLIHKGPKGGDTARVFNDTAKCIALLSFYLGGVKLFGRHWEYGKARTKV